MIIQENNKEIEVRCPICGSELYGTQYLGEIWGGIHVVEIHAHCPKCTYREEMCYSEPVKFICKTDNTQNKEKAKRLGIKIISKQEYDLI